ncbi:MAG: FAD binding domain-containing protein [Spirochaetota bacterium]
MTEKDNSPFTFTPKSLNDLLSLLRKRKEAQLYAGGTYILSRQTEKYLNLPHEIIYLGRIDDLKRVHRTERYLEIGSCVPIGRILQIGKRLLPASLYLCLSAIGSPGLRNLATIGGNLCVREMRMDSFPVLHLMDVRLELRRQGSARWLSVSRFLKSDGKPAIEPGEVLTRIRVPLENWDIQIYRKLGGTYYSNTNSLTFCGLARIQKDIVSDFRCAFSRIGISIYRNREIEAEVNGCKIPLQGKENQLITQKFSESLQEYDSSLTRFQKNRMLYLFQWFLSQLKIE